MHSLKQGGIIKEDSQGRKNGNRLKQQWQQRSGIAVTRMSTKDVGGCAHQKCAKTSVTADKFLLA